MPTHTLFANKMTITQKKKHLRRNVEHCFLIHLKFPLKLFFSYIWDRMKKFTHSESEKIKI